MSTDNRHFRRQSQSYNYFELMHSPVTIRNAYRRACTHHFSFLPIYLLVWCRFDTSSPVLWLNCTISRSVNINFICHYSIFKWEEWMDVKFFTRTWVSRECWSTNKITTCLQVKTSFFCFRHKLNTWSNTHASSDKRLLWQVFLFFPLDKEINGIPKNVGLRVNLKQILPLNFENDCSE